MVVLFFVYIDKTADHVRISVIYKGKIHTYHYILLDSVQPDKRSHVIDCIRREVCSF